MKDKAALSYRPICGESGLLDAIDRLPGQSRLDPRDTDRILPQQMAQSDELSGAGSAKEPVFWGRWGSRFASHEIFHGARMPADMASAKPRQPRPLVPIAVPKKFTWFHHLSMRRLLKGRDG
jgi:hypothetical protein